MKRPWASWLVIVLACPVVGGCAGDDSPSNAEIEAARNFRAYPLYWAGERFEKFELSHVQVDYRGISSFIYGTCDPGPHEGCPPPLEIQIRPLCRHLNAAGSWSWRHVRGAPLGTEDAAPVLYTARVQVKVYRGRGSDSGLPIRALRALRSINDVAPVVAQGERMPAAPRAVLAGAKPCRT